MIYTSSHKNCNSDKYKTLAISGNRGRDAKYVGECYPTLAPKLSFWKIWHNNIGIINEDLNNKYYIEEYYKSVLSKLDPEKIYEELDNHILLCYEDNNEFCHRHIVSAWLELLLGVEVPEIKINSDKIEKVERPAYIKEYLENFMKENNNMYGFSSIRAAYLFEKGKEMEDKASHFEEENRGYYESYIREAIFLISSADVEEENYKVKKLKNL